jgi:hypothetical protein
LVAAKALGALSAIVAAIALSNSIVVRPGERDRRVTLPEMSLASFVRLRQ